MMLLLCTLPILLASSLFLLYSYPHHLDDTAFIKECRKSWSKIKLLLPHVLPKTEAEKKLGLWLLLAILICLAIGRADHVLSPLLLRRILERIDSKQDAFPWLIIIGYVLNRYLFKDVVYFVKWNLTRRLENQVLDRVSVAVYNKIMTLSATYQDKKDTATAWSTVQSSGNDVSRFASSVVFEAVPNVLDVLLVFVSFSAIGSPYLAGIMILTLICYAWAEVKTSIRSSEDKEEWSEAHRKRSEQSSQTMFNWWTVYLFNQIPREIAKHNEVVENQRAVDTRWCNKYWRRHVVKNIIMAIGAAWIYIFLSKDIWNGKRDKADLVMFIHLWSEVVYPIQTMLRWNDKVSNFTLEIEKLVEILSQESDIKDGPEDYQEKGGAVSFRNVSFCYDDKKESALQDVSFDVRPGSTVAIVGQSGGGKSTMLKLIKRCYDVSSGSILIDDQPIQSLKLSSISSAIGIVPQNIGVFNASVMENVRYARPEASKEECLAVCKAVGFQDMIDTKIGEGGNKLSGGQLQRVAIARVLLMESKIVLLDEATSHLDSETEASIQRYLLDWRKDKTIIMVVHAFNSIWARNEAHIIAMKDGKIAEQGTEQELLATKGYYYDLRKQQQLE